MSGFLVEAARVFENEKTWLDRTLAGMGESFDEAVSLLYSTKGKIIVTGMGKSGFIARKIAATMTSTGTPAYFLHPAEAVHGDLGLADRDDTVLMLSRSGGTPELAALLPSFSRLGIRIVAISRPGSILAAASDVVIPLPDLPEACPYNLAPTASTTAMLVIGDALAMALLKAGDFSPADFADIHPGGILGRKLLTRVSDLMVPPPLPVMPEDATLPDAVDMMTKHRGICLCTDRNGALSGIFVYGDLGRLMRDRDDIRSLVLSDVLIRNPSIAAPAEPASAALARMEQRGITSLVVVDGDSRPVGLIYLHDIMRAGIY